MDECESFITVYITFEFISVKMEMENFDISHHREIRKWGLCLEHEGSH